MVVIGRVQNGVVVLDGESALPEGAVVTVSYSESPAKQATVGKTRIQVPLVRTGRPGSVDLSGERVAEILDNEDAAS
jgi:hypothetical protein